MTRRRAAERDKVHAEHLITIDALFVADITAWLQELRLLYLCGAIMRWCDEMGACCLEEVLDCVELNSESGDVTVKVAQRVSRLTCGGGPLQNTSINFGAVVLMRFDGFSCCNVADRS